MSRSAATSVRSGACQDSIQLAHATAMHGAPLPADPSPSPASQTAGEGDLAAADRAAIAVCHALAGRLFPWDLTRSLELALLKTFCVQIGRAHV